MKKKYTLILLSIVASIGVTLSGYTPALADWDRSCDGAPLNTCVEIGESGATYPVYIIKAFAGFDESGNEIPLQLGTNWPINDTANNRTIFRYITGASQEYKDGLVGKPSAQSYAVFSLYDFPALGTDPQGAIVALSSLHSSCTTLDIGERKAIKVNKAASSVKDGIIEFYEQLYTGFDQNCGHVWIIWSDNCDSGPIVTPAGMSPAPQQVTKWTCTNSGVDVTVTIDPCTRRIATVDCVRGGVNLGSERTENPWAHAIVPDPETPGSTVARSIIFGSAGPGDPGCIGCFDPLPIVVRGDEAFWCGSAP